MRLPDAVSTTTIMMDGHRRCAVACARVTWPLTLCFEFWSLLDSHP